VVDIIIGFPLGLTPWKEYALSTINKVLDKCMDFAAAVEAVQEVTF